MTIKSDRVTSLSNQSIYPTSTPQRGGGMLGVMIRELVDKKIPLLFAVLFNAYLHAAEFLLNKMVGEKKVPSYPESTGAWLPPIWALEPKVPTNER